MPEGSKVCHVCRQFIDGHIDKVLYSSTFDDKVFTFCSKACIRSFYLIDGIERIIIQKKTGVTLTK